MNKLGKYLGPVVVVLSICAAVASFLVLNQAKKFRYRSQILATSLVETAKRLDSGSGKANSVTYAEADANNKEDGTLGWPECVKEGVDLSSSNNSYANTAEQVVTLAGDVIDQRDAIIGKIDAIATTLQAPANRRPNLDGLKNLNEYPNGLIDFQAFVADRVQRDNNLRNKLNQTAGKFAVNQRYNGEIMAGGALSGNDDRFFSSLEASANTANRNFQTYRNFAQELSRTLHGARIKGITWTATPASNSHAYGNGAFVAYDGAALQKINADVKKAMQQLPRIAQLEDQLVAARREIAAQKESIAALQARSKEQEEMLTSYFQQGLGITLGKQSGAIMTEENVASIPADLTGEVVGLDDKFGQVVLSLTNRDIIKGMLFTVHQDGKFIALLKVTRVDDYNSMATVITGEFSNIRLGASVLRAPQVLSEVHQ